MYDLKLFGRKKTLFDIDMINNNYEIKQYLDSSRVMVIGGAGSIGQAVTLELLKFSPKSLHVVDISENNMVELVRKIRSTVGNSKTDFKTFAIDYGSIEFEALITSEKGYEYVFNLSALKHVRSEKDPFTLMRMIRVNIFNTLESIKLLHKKGLKKYFCVSTDKAANPVNMMGASKKIMELFLERESVYTKISTARFANVAFSDGSLLHGFNQRILYKEPISAPLDIKRYFLLPEESGQLCLLSGMLGNNKEIFFPKLDQNVNLESFSNIARSYLEIKGYTPFECNSEEEARAMAKTLIKNKKWPCFFFSSDTTGEKQFEEFYTESEEVDFSKFKDIGIVINKSNVSNTLLLKFEREINLLITSRKWDKKVILKIFKELLTNFNHLEKGKSLDDRM